MSSKWLKLGTLAILYFVQGAPYGFQASSLPVMLRKEGLSFTHLGIMKLLFLPWVCKPLYAPLIDNTMTKKFWLILTMSALGLMCFFTGSLIQMDNLMSLSLILLLLNLFSAAQDIAVDSIAVRILTSAEEVGLGNTIQVVAYKAGSIFAGGLLLLIQDYVGWTWMFYIFGSVYFICILMLVQLQLIEKSQTTKTKLDAKEPDFTKVFKEAINSPGTSWMIAFVMFYKLCERAEMTFSMFLVDKHVSTTRLAAWSSVMKTFSLVGSAYGGYAMSKGEPSRNLIKRYAVIRSFAILAQFLLILSWGKQIIVSDETFSFDWVMLHLGFLLLCIVLFCAGAMTTATFSLMMSLSQRTCRDAIRGTHYTTLATFEVLGKLVFAFVSGYLLDSIGFEPIYFLFVATAFLTVPFIKTAPASIPAN